MSDSLEHVLRRSMEALGHFVESVIGRVKKARVQVETRSGVQPILSLENQLPMNRVRELIVIATQKVVAGSIPDLRGATVLEVGEGPVLYGQRLLAAQAGKVIGAEIGGGSVGRQGDVSRGFVVRAQLSRLPFANERFGYLVARMATQLQSDMGRTIRELGRVLAHGGQGVIVDYHPFGLYATRGTTRLRPIESAVRHFEDYYRLCREAGMRVMNVREAFIDEGMRNHFREDEIHAYRNLKGTPLLVFLFVYKPKGR